MKGKYCIFLCGLLTIFVLRIVGAEQKEGVSAQLFPIPHSSVPAPQTEVLVFPQLGYPGIINTVAFVSYGNYIISNSSNNLIMWATNTGRKIKIFEGHNYEIETFCVTPDEKFIISGSNDGILKLWDISKGKELKTFDGRWDLSSIAVSPDGKHALSTGRSFFDHTFKLWNINSGKVVRVFAGHKKAVNSVAISPGGKYVLSGSDDLTLKLWDIDTGLIIRSFEGHTNHITSIMFSPDGKYIISGSADKTIKLWDIDTGLIIRTFEGHLDRVNSVAISPDGKYVLSGSSDCTSKLWNLSTGHIIRSFDDHTDRVTSVAFSPDGKNIISGSNVLKLWDLATGKEIRTFGGYGAGVNSVSISVNGKYAVSVSSDNNLILWDIIKGQRIRSIKRQPSQYNLMGAAIFSPDGNYILSFSSDVRDLSIKLWDTYTGQFIRNFEGHTWFVSSIAFSPNGEYFLSGSWDKTIKMWNIVTGENIKTFYGNSGFADSVVFSPDGKYFLSCSTDKSIKLWNIATGQIIRTFEGLSWSADSVVVSNDWKYAFSSSPNMVLSLWDISTGKSIKMMKGHNENIISRSIPISLSSDGKNAFSGSLFGDNTLVEWDTNSGIVVKTFEGHNDNVNSINVSTNSNLLFSASDDGTVRLWDIETGKEIASFISFTDGEWIVITPDGFYNSSPKGDQYLNVRINNNVFGMDQFSKSFYHPEIVEARLQGLPDPLCTCANNPIFGKDAVKERGSIKLASVPPSFTVIQGEVDMETRHVTLSITAKDEIHQIKDLQIIVNGRLIGGEELAKVTAENLEVKNTRLVASPGREYEFSITLRLDPGLNRIEIVAENDRNFGLTQLPLSAPEAKEEEKGDLYLLAVGVNKYKLYPYYDNLLYAVSDAQKIIDSFKKQKGRRFNCVNVLFLSDSEATRQNIIDNMVFLQRAAGSNDVAMLYLSGHGEIEKGVYYFFPSDTALDNDGSLITGSAVSISELTEALDIPGRKIVLLDTCHSEVVDTNRIVHSLRNRSTVIFSAAQTDQFAFETGLSDGGSGLFTSGVTEGIGGKAAADGVVRIRSLEEYVIKHVLDASKELIERLKEKDSKWQLPQKEQRPSTWVPESFRDFLISLVE